ncbi:hypothetical protein [Actinophytocola sp.]|uniref:hypothetical protein n=1 Tax=Actinophytocola sp. TaxID=1872138 RepID=UPI002D80200E|nr:hypothetical protein [Actinophytocola sp.]HET9138738.1 hypothetical protein [Actinophytocola sp.]
MDLAALSLDELIAASAELDDRAYRVFERLARITARAAGETGVEVEVNLDGMITAVRLTAESLRLPADRLAAEIFRLTSEAAAAALREGVALLEPVAGEPLLDLLTVPPPAPPPGPEEDFSTVATWATG